MRTASTRTLLALASAAATFAFAASASAEEEDALLPGFRFGTRPRWGLAGTGLALAATHHFASSLVGLGLTGMGDYRFAPMAIPVAGPIITAVQLFGSDSDFAAVAHVAGLIGLADALQQSIGIVLFAVGFAEGYSIVERDTVSLRVGPTGAFVVSAF